jgi:hypothetical protein
MPASKYHAKRKDKKPPKDSRFALDNADNNGIMEA